MRGVEERALEVHPSDRAENLFKRRIKYLLRLSKMTPENEQSYADEDEQRYLDM